MSFLNTYFCIPSLVGYILFEALQMRDCMWKGSAINPFKTLKVYLIIVLILAAIASFLGKVLSNGTIPSELFIGFSLPSSIKVLQRKSAEADSISSDDSSLKKLETVTWYSLWKYRFLHFISCLNIYFGR